MTDKYHRLPERIFDFISDRDNTVLLETSKFDSENRRSYLFVDPVQVIKAKEPDDVVLLFESIEGFLNNGYYLAGYLSYECGYAFEEIGVPPRLDYPMAIIGVFEKPIVFDHVTGKFDRGFKFDDPGRYSGGHPYSVDHLSLETSKDDYCRDVARILDYIDAGDTYQVNYTARLCFDVQGSLRQMYLDLRRKQPVAYGAYLHFGEDYIFSFSPELFFRREGNTLVARPMKGTVRRGRTNREDEELSAWLAQDEKNQAENIMIVDLLRNDFGRIAKRGSVNVGRLYEVERFATLMQMTSTISASVDSRISWSELLRSLFPSGSVTGAPKIAAMRIIHEVEKRPRGIYTGSIGFISPEGNSAFNVAIRTIRVNRGQGEMGVGSGIVGDSLADREYDECLLKGEFLTKPMAEFQLLESMLWDRGYLLLESHLQRLSESARYFNFSYDQNLIRSELLLQAKSFCLGTRYKIRLKLDAEGHCMLEYSSLVPETSKQIDVANAPTCSTDRFLYHKTTWRTIYDAAYTEAAAIGMVDRIFKNERGEITEGTRNNIFVQKGSHLFTPPLECGLLDGVYRRYLIENRNDVIESVLFESDLHEADRIYLCNAVRGLREVKLSSR